MVWCIEQADCGEEVVECLAESLSILEVCTQRELRASEGILKQQKATLPPPLLISPPALDPNS